MFHGRYCLSELAPTLSVYQAFGSLQQQARLAVTGCSWKADLKVSPGSTSAPATAVVLAQLQVRTDGGHSCRYVLMGGTAAGAY